MATEKNPQELTIRGRLSYPYFTYASALAFQKNYSRYPKKDEDVKPSIQMLLDQSQADLLVKHVLNELLPWADQMHKKEPKKFELQPMHTKKLRKILEEGDWEVEKIVNLIQPVNKKTLELAPEAVFSTTVSGRKMQDLVQKALIKDESELKNQMEELVIPPRGTILPIEDTTHTMYAGCNVGTRINMWPYLSSGSPQIIASTSVVVFLSDNTPFSTAGSMDEDAFIEDVGDMFLEDNED